MRASLIALVWVACSSSADPTTAPAPNGPNNHGAASAPTDRGSQATNQGSQATSQGSQTMSQNNEIPGGTGVDEHGVLLRSKPDPNAPKPDPTMLADDAANLLYCASGVLGDPAIIRRAWQQLHLADASGSPTPRMTEFVRANQEWVRVNNALLQTVATPAKARVYLDAHLK